MITKNVSEALLQRRSVRAYQDKPISNEDKESIFQAILRAPTAGNMALYSVIDVQDAEVKRQLSVLCDHQDMIARAPMCLVFIADFQKWFDYYRAEDCPQKSGKPWREPGLGELHLALQDSIIACQSGVVMAESLGIGSCYIGDVLENGEAMQKLLNLPRYTMPSCMVIMGYKHDTPVGKLSARCPATDMFMTDRYQLRSKEALESAFNGQEKQAHAVNRLPYGNTGTLADYYYEKKYITSFMKEMNRSVAWWFDRWEKGRS